MSWASNRETTSEEDIAYCLLGIFGVHMPLLYGEGENAFRRLQEEILKTTEDYTLFAWDGSSLPFYVKNNYRGIGALASSPSLFYPGVEWESTAWSLVDPQTLVLPQDSSRKVDVEGKTVTEPPRFTPRRIHLMLPIVQGHGKEECTLLFLCCIQQPKGELICLQIEKVSENERSTSWTRTHDALIFLVPGAQYSISFVCSTVYINGEHSRRLSVTSEDDSTSEFCDTTAIVSLGV